MVKPWLAPYSLRSLCQRSIPSRNVTCGPGLCGMSLRWMSPSRSRRTASYYVCSSFTHVYAAPTGARKSLRAYTSNGKYW